MARNLNAEDPVVKEGCSITNLSRSVGVRVRRRNPERGRRIFLPSYQIYLIVRLITCEPLTTYPTGVDDSFTADSPNTTICCVARMPSITFITESGTAGITLSSTVACGFGSSRET